MIAIALVSLVLTDTNFKNQDVSLGPVNIINCSGAGITCTRSGAQGNIVFGGDGGYGSAVTTCDAGSGTIDYRVGFRLPPMGQCIGVPQCSVACNAACPGGEFATGIDSSGGLTCASVPAGGVTTIGPFGSSPNGNGGTISGNTLTLQPADESNPGGVSTANQSFSGVKSFFDPVNLYNGCFGRDGAPGTGQDGTDIPISAGNGGSPPTGAAGTGARVIVVGGAGGESVDDQAGAGGASLLFGGTGANATGVGAAPGHGGGASFVGGAGGNAVSPATGAGAAGGAVSIVSGNAGSSGGGAGPYTAAAGAVTIDTGVPDTSGDATVDICAANANTCTIGRVGKTALFPGAIAIGTPLAIGYGGTNGTATPTNGGVCYGSGMAYAFTAAGSSSKWLRGGTPPAFDDLPSEAAQWSFNCVNCTADVPWMNPVKTTTSGRFGDPQCIWETPGLGGSTTTAFKVRDETASADIGSCTGPACDASAGVTFVCALSGSVMTAGHVYHFVMTDDGNCATPPKNIGCTSALVSQ